MSLKYPSFLVLTLFTNVRPPPPSKKKEKLMNDPKTFLGPKFNHFWHFRSLGKNCLPEIKQRNSTSFIISAFLLKIGDPREENATLCSSGYLFCWKSTSHRLCINSNSSVTLKLDSLESDSKVGPVLVALKRGDTNKYSYFNFGLFLLWTVHKLHYAIKLGRWLAKFNYCKLC